MEREMKRASLIGILAGGILLSGAGVSHADIYMKIEGVQGESVAKGRTGQVDISDFTFGAAAPATVGGSAGGIAVGKPKYQEVIAKKVFDSASEELLRNMGLGKTINSIIIEVTKPTGGDTQQTYVRYTFNTCAITSDSLAASVGDPYNETFSFIYKSFKVEYYKQSPDGKLASSAQTLNIDVVSMKVS